MAYRDSELVLKATIERLEREKGELAETVREQARQIAEQEAKEEARTGFYLSFSDDQVRELEKENKELHQEVIMLRSGVPPQLAIAIGQMSKATDLMQPLQQMRREVRRTRLLIVLMFLAYAIRWMI